MTSNADNIKKLVGFVDVTPTWEEILPTMLAVFRDGNAKGVQTAVEELTRMAKLADRCVRTVNGVVALREQYQDRYLGKSGDVPNILMKLNSVLKDSSDAKN